MSFHHTRALIWAQVDTSTISFLFGIFVLYSFGEDMLFNYSLALFLFFSALFVFLVFLLVRSLYRSLKHHRSGQAKAEQEANKVEREAKNEVVPVEAVKAVLIQRIDGIKNKNAEAIESLVDRDKYTKFDDWPPFHRQGLNALKREADALKVLREYEYETSDWKIDIYGDVALASFIINYRGTIRKLKFNIRSRITAFLVQKKGSWKLTHEHWSRFRET